MNLSSSLFKDEIFPGLEDAWNLRLHPLAGIEERTHRIYKVVKLLKLLHKSSLRQKSETRLDQAALTFSVCVFSTRRWSINVFNKLLQAEYLSYVSVHQARDALNLVAKI